LLKEHLVKPYVTCGKKILELDQPRMVRSRKNTQVELKMTC